MKTIEVSEMETSLQGLNSENDEFLETVLELISQRGNMTERYFLEEVVRGYKWLGHNSGYTELNALHPSYRKGDKEHNLRNGTFPKIAYAKSEKEVVDFVKKYAQTHMVSYGLNPRPEAYKNDHKYPRSAADIEIAESKNLVFDFDFIDKNTTRHDHNQFAMFLRRVDDSYKDLGFRAPVRAFTGRGYHLLFSYPSISLEDHPDLRGKLRQFRQHFYMEHKHDLNKIGAKLDSTFDIRRMVRIYGTAKPNTDAIPSKFFGHSRIEDIALREYILGMEEHPIIGKRFEPNGSLPDWFTSLLEKDTQLKQLWEGTEKPAGTDHSRSGFDYSLVRRLIYLGHRNLDELAAILANRPNGAGHDKGQRYIWTTIGNALMR
jgi:hypothetical protein